MRHQHKVRAGLALALAGLSGMVMGGIAHADTVQSTGVTGGSQPFSNYQPSLVLNQTIALRGIFPSCSGGATTTSYIGMIHTFAGNFGPFGMPTASGQLLPISQNTVDFAILGTQYGGNGVNNFALPDLRGRAVVGSGQGVGLPSFTTGQQIGTGSVTLTVANLPAHDHGYADGTTSVVGGNQPFDNYQPSLAMTYMIAADGVYPTGGGHTMVGEIGLFAGNYAAGSWLPADGRLLPISQFSTLFDVIGTTYGGDGINSFALPDLRGRTAVGVGQGAGLSPVSLGEMFGTPTVTLTEGQMPAHTHDLPTGGTTDVAGGSQPFSTEEPSLGLNYLIALQGVFPSYDGNAAVPDSQPYLGEVIAFAGNIVPSGWALAQGQLLSIMQNQALFAILGTTYGGDGRTTFALPDLRGRTILGAGDNFTLGEKLGSETTTLTLANLAAHAHDYTLPEAPTPAVPEPASWALLIAGFAMAGGAMRRRGMQMRFAQS